MTSDYVLERVVGEGPGYQDWRAEHVQIKDSKRRIRLYLAEDGTSAQQRQTLQRAALREFQLLETLQHPGVLRVHLPVEHELGPALIFEDDPLAIRLDHYLLQMRDKLSTDARLDLLRQIAEVIRYAHDKRIVHRALCPQSILVTGITSDRPRIKVFNWQVISTPSWSSGRPQTSRFPMPRLLRLNGMGNPLLLRHSTQARQGVLGDSGWYQQEPIFTRSVNSAM